ncbi:hypothetical protein O6H91_23G065800 [Diphasiastrum complanatum]|uniref:Uncharacterized protein n=1 Tax=Diphasiastrum complanatum TaxID=34168 RepID=A0ACC2ABQ2_DIPCM|nr:hypothetical protein O6H91_23G065800 [Diphasiastrum complanatum]
MLTFTALAGQIRLLITCLDKNNYNSVAYELNLGEVQNLQLKLELLAVVIRHLLHQPNFATVLCEALGRAPSLSEDFLGDLSKALKLSLPEQIGLGLALADADDAKLRQEGESFASGKVSELCQNPSVSISESLVEQILLFLHQSEGLSKHMPAFIRTLPLLKCNADDSLLLTPLLHDEVNEINSLRSFERISISELQNLEGIISRLNSVASIAEIMEEIGYSCTVDVQHFLDLLSLFPPPDDKDIAKVVGMVACTHTGLEDSQGVYGAFSASVCDSLPLSADASWPMAWNLDVILEAIKQMELDINWKTVMECMDYEGFYIPDQKAFALLMSFYQKAAQDPFPIEAVCGSPWKNGEGQLSFLKYAISASPEVFSFSHSPKKQEALEGLHGQKLSVGSLNYAWLSLDLIEALCSLAEAGYAATVRSLLDYPLKHCPEILLLGLAQVETEWNLIQSEVFFALFPSFLGNNPNNSVILHQLWFLNREIVIRGMVDAHSKDPSSISRILDVCQDLKVLPLVLETSPFPFVIDLAALASRREYLNLEKWLHDSLSTHRDTLFQACLKFLREKTLVEGRSDSNTGPGIGQRTGTIIGLSLETTAIFLKALQSHSGQLTSRELGEEMKRIHAAAIRVNPRLLSIGASEQSTSEVFASDVEEEANSYFQRIYGGQLTIENVVDMLEHFNGSRVQREREIFGCMIQSLFDEYRFFPRYPERELRITAVLFGSLIKHQLVDSLPLGIALRCVLDALRKPLDSKMFSFGLTALEQFQERLVEWPQYCNHILQISHMEEAHAELVEFIERALARVSSGQIDSNMSTISPVEQHPSSAMQVPMALSSGPLEHVDAGQLQQLQQQLPLQLQFQQQQLPQEERLKTALGSLVFGKAATSAQIGSIQQPPSSQLFDSAGGQKILQSSQSLLYSQAGSSQSLQITTGNQGFLRTPRGSAVAGVLRQPSSTPGFGHALNIETLVAAAERRDTPIDAPSLDVQDKVAFIINNISTTNLDPKAKECLEVLKEQFYPWFAQYMVMKRASIEPNFHDLYLKFLDKINSKALHREIVKATYENCKVLLRSELIKSSSEERSLLKNLGSWLGKLTIGRNQALRAREIDPKSLIIEAYEKGLMIAVIPFTSKILEPCQSSLAYQPPNPWTMGILGLLAEIYALPNLKMNLKFDIEVLFKNLGVDMKDVKPTLLLKGRSREVEGYRDFSNKDLGVPHQPPAEHNASLISSMSNLELLPDLASSTSVPAGSQVGTLAQGNATGHLSSTSIQQEDEKAAVLSASERTLNGQGVPQSTSSSSHYSAGQITMSFPNLSPYVVLNQKLGGVSQQLQLSRILPLAMERAIREIISPVVDRSVTIACMTTRELVIKDFAMEADDSRTHHSANLMVASLAGSLAHVTCKEPLRVAMATHLRNLLQALSISGKVLDQAVQIVTNDNLDLGCAVIEKAATEKALRDLDETLGAILVVRRKQREALGASFYDASIYSQGNLARLPEALRPKLGRLSPAQQRVYEDFARLPWQNQPTQNQALPPASVALSGPSGPAGISVGSSLTRSSYPSSLGQGSFSSFTGVIGTHTSAGLGSISQPPEANLEDFDLRSTTLSFTSPVSLGSLDGVIQIQDIPGITGSFTGSNTAALDADAAETETNNKGAAPTASPSSSPPLPEDQIGSAAMEPSFTTGEAIEKYTLVAQKLDAAVLNSSTQIYSSLTPENELRILVKEIPEIITQSVSRDEAALAIAQKAFKRLFDNTANSLHVSVHLAILESIRDVCKRVVKELTSWVIYSDEDRKFNREIIVGLIRSELINLMDYNIHLAKFMDGGRNTTATDFAIYLVKTCIIQEAGVSASELYNVIETLSKVAQRPGSPESLQQLIDIAKNTPSMAIQSGQVIGKDDKSKLLKEKKPSNSRGGGLREEGKVAGRDTAAADPSGLRDQVVVLFDEWARICDAPGANDKAYAVYISQLQHSGMLKGDDTTDRFFRILLDLAVTHCLNTETSLPTSISIPAQQGQSFSFAAIDMYAKLVVLLVKYYAVDPAMSKVNLLNKVLNVAVRVIQRDSDEKQTSFYPRPYFRLLVTWLMDFNSPDPSLDSSNFQVLTAFGNAFLSLQPLRVPGWSFAWLELISHRVFMPKLLLSNSQKGWPMFQRLLVALFKFMDPYLRNADLSDPVRLLYKGTLRVLLVLLHDFPEFLCDYHFSFCDVIPPSCIQMRNLILSAFPRNMRLPDPFTPNLKVDLLPEISQAPRILSDVEHALKNKQLKAEVDDYLKTRQPLSLFSVDLKQRLMLPQHEAATSGTRYNVALINALVLYVGIQAIQQLQSKTTPPLAVPTAPITHSAPMDVFQRLIIELDTEGRYLFLNAVANQLRYPNNHTHYFSCVLLYLFAEANQEIIQEQITRVLLERLIVNRPHPWGLLITFIELIKNPRYNFWSHSFTRCAPEIERLFESVARSCMGPPLKPVDDELSSGLSAEGMKG